MTRLLLFFTVGCVIAGTAFAAISFAQHAGVELPRIIQTDAGPVLVSNPEHTAVPTLADALPSFGRARAPDDVAPRGGLIFGARRDIDAGASRRLFAHAGYTIFAAPSHDRRKVCFVVTEDQPDAIWGATFCSSAGAVRRAEPIIWNMNFFRTQDGPRRLIWGIAALDVSVVSLGPIGAPFMPPNSNGVFLFDVSESGSAPEILALDARGTIVASDAIPRGVGAPLPA